MHGKLGFTLPATFLIALLCLAAAGPAAADSIYLKNGRVIQAAEARVDGDRVVFLLHGAWQAIPAALVDRIEANALDRPTGAAPAGAASGGAGTVPATAGDAPSTLPDLAASGDPQARLQALSAMFSGPEGAQALSVLQELSTADGAGGLEAALPLLGALGGGFADTLGQLGGTASELEQIQTLLPPLIQLSSALFAPEYSAEATDAAARDLLRSLSALGVSDDEIRAKARQFGVPEEVLQRIGRR